MINITEKTVLVLADILMNVVLYNTAVMLQIRWRFNRWKTMLIFVGFFVFSYVIAYTGLLIIPTAGWKLIVSVDFAGLMFIMYRILSKDRLVVLLYYIFNTMLAGLLIYGMHYVFVSVIKMPFLVGSSLCYGMYGLLIYTIQKRKTQIHDFANTVCRLTFLSQIHSVVTAILVYVLLLCMEDNPGETMIILFLVIVCMVISYFELLQAVQEMKKAQENILLQKQTQSLKNELEQQQERISLIKEYRSNMQYYTSLVRNYLLQGKVEEAVQSIDEVSENMEVLNLKQFCDNLALNSVLTLFEEKAKHRQITFQVKVDQNEEIILTSMEITTIFSNILENAMEACEKIREGQPKYIRVYCSMDDKRIKIQVCNSSLPVEMDEHGKPSPNNQNEGIGTISISRIVEEHNGLLRFGYQKGIFDTSIIFFINESQ